VQRLFSATAFALVYSIGVYAQNKPHSDFHSNVVSKAKAAEAPIKSSNPHVIPYAAIIAAAKWPLTNIPVCWENPDARFTEGMTWTRDAVVQTWEKHSKLKFSGWSKCAEVNNGIRIRIADSGPHVKSLGRFLDRVKDGMVLNFTFANWSQSCQSQVEFCIRAIAVHEFGHAVALTHEQNRPDAPGECKLLAQGSNPDTLLTPYDPQSVMNYCNKNWNNDGFLSALDIAAIQDVYGKP